MDEMKLYATEEWVLMLLLKREQSTERTTVKDIVANSEDVSSEDIETLLKRDLITIEQSHRIESIQHILRPTTLVFLTKKGREYLASYC